jgi:hypothetical protein
MIWIALSFFFTIEAYDFFHLENYGCCLKGLDQARVGCVLGS